jgi:Protein of unknown function (DUF2752)
VPPSDDTPPPSPPPIPVVQAVRVAPPADDSGSGFEYVDDDSDWDDCAPPQRPRRAPRYVRVFLAAMAVGFAAVLITAACLRPYDADGSANRMGTHMQLGLEPCNMVLMTGKPCPACGMTTSFALLVHGDVANSLRANWVGTLFCASLFVLAPWAAVSAWRGRLVWVRNGELFATILLSSLLLLMMGRWAWVVFG